MKIEELKEGQKILVECEFDSLAGANQAWVLVQGDTVLAQLDDIKPYQPKPKMPQFILDWVNNSRERHYDFDEWFDCDNQPMEVYKWLNRKNKRQADLNALALVTLIVNGPDAVTVEKEKLYTVEIPTNSEDKLALVRREDKKIVITIVGGRWRGLDIFQLTEQEIRKDFDWAWQWKKEVTE